MPRRSLPGLSFAGSPARLAAALLAACLGLAWFSPARADFDDALRAYERGDDATALRELKPLVAKGSPLAEFLLGVMREAGRGDPKNPAEAATLYRKAADGGHVGAMVALGVLYLRGLGVAQSDFQADAFFRKAAAKGSAKALYLLGLMRLEKRGGSAADAPGLLRRAVKAGSAEAAATLGEMLLAGQGVPRDPAEAYRLALTGQSARDVDAATQARLAGLAQKAEKALDPTQALALRGRYKAGQAGAGSVPDKAPDAGHMVTGTGFVVSRLGHVLTNAHVAGKCGRLEAVVDGKRTPATLLRLDPKNDLALAKLAVAPPRAAIFREGGDMPEGAAIFAVGYPGRTALTGQLTVATGQTRDLAAMAGPGQDQAVSALVRPGNSGGPLLDASGHVAGVIRAGRDKAAVAAVTGDAPADMGFAIELNVVKAFLSRGQVPYVTSPAGRTLDAAAITREAQGVVVPLFCLPADR